MWAFSGEIYLQLTPSNVLVRKDVLKHSLTLPVYVKIVQNAQAHQSARGACSHQSEAH